MSARRLAIVALTAMSLVATAVEAKSRPDEQLLERIFSYASTIDTAGVGGHRTYAYCKFLLNVKRRNALLLPVPTMYRIAHGPRRRYIAETYNQITHKSLYDLETRRQVIMSTIPRHKVALPTLKGYLLPKIYDETIFGNQVLSPFHRSNRSYYRYRFIYLYDDKVSIQYRPKVKSTQLVEGTAIVDGKTGMIVSGLMRGEYDMISFHLNYTMGQRGVETLLPALCDVSASFKFLGNKIEAKTTAVYGLPQEVSDTIFEKEDTTLMATIRREPLKKAELEVYNDYYSEVEKRKSVVRKERSWAKVFFWDILGDNLLNKIASNYGGSKQGHMRISPLFNPLYMGYSGRKGFYYKFDIRNTYNFTTNSYLYSRFKAGYSFKRRQLYYSLPIEYHFDRRRHGYVEFNLGNGNWIGNGVIRQKALEQLPDTVAYNAERLDYFKDFNLSLTANYDISRHISLQLGIVSHRRVAVEPETYRKAGMATRYTSVAPKIEVTWRPMGWKGPVVNGAYERSIKGFFGADIAYERWEFDIQHIVQLNRLRSLSFRAGSGFYTMIDGVNYFLDYSNFRDNNIPGGWNDEWSGEFSLLHSEWYNLSRYYVRTNVTYETPLLIVSRLPLVGRYIEKERIYTNALWVSQLHPYIELGYGFTTRWLSAGLFMANRNGRYDGFGVKIGLELFRQW